MSSFGPFLFYIKYCINGHGLYNRDFLPEDKNCNKCGELYFEKCGYCSQDIPNSFISKQFSNGYLFSNPTRPDHCHNCGKPYPWVEAKIKKIENAGVWLLLHPTVVKVAKTRFESGHYADAVEATFKELNAKIKSIYKTKRDKELDGVNLMRSAFSPNNPLLIFSNLDTETGKNMQQGYMEIFAGAIAAIRNPKAHDNIDITAEMAVHFLFFSSLLFLKLGTAKVFEQSEEE